MTTLLDEVAPTDPNGRQGTASASRKWPLVFAVLPLAAIGELVAGEVQHRAVPTADDWARAAAAAASAKRPGDVILIAPRWASELGAKALGDLARSRHLPPDTFYDVRVAARPDLDTAARVLELSAYGADDPDTRGWRRIEEQSLGGGRVRLRTLQNPAPQKLLRDLVDEIDQTAKVSRVGPGGIVEPCRWEDGGTQHMPALFAGPVPPSRRWDCPPFDPSWTFVGATVITDLGYTPRRCILMHPTGDARTTVELPPRPIGKLLVGYVGLHVYLERELKYAPVWVRVSIDGREVASARHRDGDGWLKFRGSTEAFAGEPKPVKIETWAEGGRAQLRLMCVSVQLREGV